MQRVEVRGIKWDTNADNIRIERLPDEATVDVSNHEDREAIKGALVDFYGYNVESFGEVEHVLRDTRVIKKWAHHYDKEEVIHSSIPEDEAREICSDPSTSGTDQYGPWAYFWYYND